MCIRFTSIPVFHSWFMSGLYIVSDVVIRAKQWRKRAQAAKDGTGTHVSTQMCMVNLNVWFRAYSVCMCIRMYFVPFRMERTRVRLQNMFERGH